MTKYTHVLNPKFTVKIMYWDEIFFDFTTSKNLLIQ